MITSELAKSSPTSLLEVNTGIEVSCDNPNLDFDHLNDSIIEKIHICAGYDGETSTSDNMAVVISPRVSFKSMLVIALLCLT